MRSNSDRCERTSFNWISTPGPVRFADGVSGDRGSEKALWGRTIVSIKLAGLISSGVDDGVVGVGGSLPWRPLAVKIMLEATAAWRSKLLLVLLKVALGWL